ncbi:hypothetical protein OH77DRAFT_1436111 [Trametes cingulata]|nr:hypothetical protein OH77DRAFT_1436111 [Trametes cingulata]
MDSFCNYADQIFASHPLEEPYMSSDDLDFMRQYFDVDGLSAGDEPLPMDASVPRSDATFPSQCASAWPLDASYPPLEKSYSWLDTAFPAIEPAVPHAYRAGLEFVPATETTERWSPADTCFSPQRYGSIQQVQRSAMRQPAARESGVTVSLPQVIRTDELAMWAASYVQPPPGSSSARPLQHPAEPKAPWSTSRAKPASPVERPSAPGPCERKRGTSDADFFSAPSKRPHCTASHPSSKPAPPPPAPAPAREARVVPCTDGPKPIVLAPKEGLFCPMPHCRVKLAPVDSIWRGHFKTVHHRDLCGHGGSCDGKAACVYACPFPTSDGTRCVAKVPMTVDSLGRHVLNVHLQLVHRCPLCGVEKVQRYSACKRHIDNHQGLFARVLAPGWMGSRVSEDVRKLQAKKSPR